MDVFKVLLAFFLPPAGVFLQVGLRVEFWLSILLTVLGWLPGSIYAVYIVVTRPPQRGALPS